MYFDHVGLEGHVFLNFLHLLWFLHFVLSPGFPEPRGEGFDGHHI